MISFLVVLVMYNLQFGKEQDIFQYRDIILVHERSDT